MAFTKENAVLVTDRLAPAMFFGLLNRIVFCDFMPPIIVHPLSIATKKQNNSRKFFLFYRLSAGYDYLAYMGQRKPFLPAGYCKLPLALIGLKVVLQSFRFEARSVSGPFSTYHRK